MDNYTLIEEIERLKHLINDENREEIEIQIDMLQYELKKGVKV